MTCLMPGATETDFFERADMLDTKIGTSKKQDPAEVAEIGFKAMMNGDGEVVAGCRNKLRAAIAHVLPADLLAETHRTMAQPGFDSALRSKTMKALCWHGKGDIRCDDIPDPKIEHPRDAIIKVTSCAICGSDLHIYDGVIPAMEHGDCLGHETMGEVVEVGEREQGIKVGGPCRCSVHDRLR